MDKLYYVVLVVELQEGVGGKSVPFISYKYPTTCDDTVSASVTQFCFPDINQFPTEVMPREAFSFVLTEGDGERRFGYCLRKLPPGKGPRYPVGFSIMAYFPCFELYTKILDRVAHHYYESSMSELTEFVESILHHKFPKPGDTFEVTIRTQFATSPVRFTRPKDNDSLLAHIELDTLLTHLDERNILIIFISLVIERRIIFCSSALSVLSSCIQTAIALLYPLTWQHIYIPVLPKSLLSFVCAPMPFVVGVLKTELDEVLNSPMDEVLIVDLDDNYFIRTPGPNPTDDLDLLPPTYTDNIRKSLRATTKMIKRVQRRKKERRSDADDLAEKQLNYELSRQKNTLTDAFIQFFIKIIGGYRNHLNSNSVFDKEGFVNSQPSEIHSFMEMLIGAQMFERFIQESSSGVAEGFDNRIKHAAKLAEMASGAGDRDVDASKRPSTKKVFGWSTLRGNSKKEPNISIGAPTSIAIGAPTLIKATTEREGKEVKPNVPPKLSHPPPPKLVTPTKSLPLAPGRTAPSATAPSSPKPSPPPPVNRPLSSRPLPSGPSGGPPGGLSRQQSIPTHVYLQQKQQQKPAPTSEDDASARLKRQSLNGIAPMNEPSQDDPNWNKRHSVVVRGRGRGRGGPEIGDRVRPVSVRPGSLQPYTDFADLRSSDSALRPPPQRALPTPSEGGPPRPPPRTPPQHQAQGGNNNASAPSPRGLNECGSPLTPGRRPMPVRKGRGEAPPSPAN